MQDFAHSFLTHILNVITISDLTVISKSEKNYISKETDTHQKEASTSNISLQSVFAPHFLMEEKSMVYVMYNA